MSLQVFGCPGCEQPFQVDSGQAGQQVRCPGCHDVVQIPDSIGDSSALNPAIPSAVSPEGEPEVPEAFDCPACQAAFGVLPSMYGSTMACPHCGQAVALERTPPPVPASPGKRGKAPEIQIETDSVEASAGAEAVPEAVPEVAVFVPRNVDHLLPPRFATLDPAFFYRRGNKEDQVLLPQAGGGIQAVSNRIVTIIHKGKEYQLIASPRYRRNLDIVVNALLVLVALGLLLAIWWAC